MSDLPWRVYLPRGFGRYARQQGAKRPSRGVAAERSAQRACERSSDWRRGAAGSPDPDAFAAHHFAGSRDPDAFAAHHFAGSPDPDEFAAHYFASSPDPDAFAAHHLSPDPDAFAAHYFAGSPDPDEFKADPYRFMTRFLIRRALQNILLLMVMSVITFALLHLAPNSPFVIEGDPNQSAADVERLRANYGLDQSLPVQYALWVGRLLHGDLGRSFATPEPVASLIWDRLPATLILAVSALVLSFGVGVPMGIYAAVHRGTWIDNTLRVFSVVVDATPRFWLGLLAIVFLGGQLGWFPQGGMYDLSKRDVFDPLDRLRHLILPALILASAGWVGLSRVMRGETLEVLNQDYVRTALGKGLRWHAVLWGHVVRNALLPLVTNVAGILPGLVSGAALIEIVFSWPGLGRLALDSALRHDFPVILANWLIISALVLLGRMIADVLYAVVDPRVRLAE